MNDLEINYNVFESIKHIDEHGYEYWSARELGKVLEYSEYRKFLLAINKAIVACKLSYQNIDDHFVQTGGMINIGKGGKRKVTDYKLSRYACYLIVQNAGVKNFDKFHNAGYKGLYNGETANDITKKKRLKIS